ncbi:PREDICTED: transcription factor DIVARICATA-like [Camelina sativa]|uniref:Transcription factor DIVARICATA-like n=1 Tax=Camelina sativa TaxID=90675 RepID=A0ABM0XI79_CAMSA|nr:PREDICTED: transcription factor DIVARICATA-like [Camelina sativa]
MVSIPRWTKEDNKHFEIALAQFPEGSPSILESIAEHLRKPVEEVKFYYDDLVYDVEQIETGKVPLPKYRDDDDDYVSLKKAAESKSQGTGRKKGIPWTPEEHRLFLDGLEKYGKGDWKSISRECVKTRSPMQVASHAQKYYLRQSSDSKKGKRSSIHDVTLGHADNVTVPGSNLKSMGHQPHFGDQIPPDQYYQHYSQDNFGLFDDDAHGGCLPSYDELYSYKF